MTPENDDDVGRSRIAFSRSLATTLAELGHSLAAFGLADGDRKAIGIVIQMAGELATGTVLLFDQKNWYGGAALLRQVVEVEYLLFLFATDSAEPQRWLASSPADLRRLYRPAAMRARSGGQFRDAEYWTHCDLGGHPHRKAVVLLPDRIEAVQFRDGSLFWGDLAHHLTRIWHTIEALLKTYGLDGLPAVHEAFRSAALAHAPWYQADPNAQRPPRSFVLRVAGEGQVSRLTTS